MRYPLFATLALTVLCASCADDRPTPSPHDSYRSALERDNSDSRATRWEAEAVAALLNPLPIALPYSERRVLEAEHVRPIAFVVDLFTDQLLQVEILPAPDSQIEVFVDVFFIDATEETSPRRVDSMAAGKNTLTLSANQKGRYLVRLQPSYASMGLVDTIISSPPRFGFPVRTTRENAVQSFFGAPRDGGERSHKGIDIFAERGTPVLAAASGRVTSVGETQRGGKQVWVHGDGRSFYYAHLDSITVATGDFVERGQTLGTVGNTGNAVTTEPHLHFGIHGRWHGAVDPLPLVGSTLNVATAPLPDVQLVSRWLSIAVNKVNVRAGPSSRHAKTETLTRGDLVRVDALTTDWLRITTGSGRTGFVAHHLTELPVEVNVRLEKDYFLASQPQLDAPIIGEVFAGQQTTALGRFGAFTLLKVSENMHGWARMPVRID